MVSIALFSFLVAELELFDMILVYSILFKFQSIWDKYEVGFRDWGQKVGIGTLGAVGWVLGWRGSAAKRRGRIRKLLGGRWENLFGKCYR